MKSSIANHAQQPFRAIINLLVETSVLVMAAYQLLSGEMTISTFVLFLYVIRSIRMPITKLGNTFIVTQGLLASSERIFELLSLRPEIVDGPGKISRFNDSIQLQGISFSYGSGKVLKNINLDIKKGEIVALVGPSGAGKSTLSDLILRFYDPTEGAIVIDSRDLRSLQQRDYRRLFGVVPQEPLLFNASVSENIAYGSDGVTRENILHAAKIANATEFIDELPQGYDTLVGDRGIRLSGGQRQRVAIARAVVHEPHIILLDEATSSLDSQSERLVQHAIDRVIENATGIVIAHRLSTVMNADKIVVMNRGVILDQGRHNELLKRCELYHRLCELQFDLNGNGVLNNSDDHRQF